MALTQSTEVPDSVRHIARPVSSNNVIPFPLSRVLLPVTLLRESEEEARAQLKSLLHSPLGVYVVKTEVVRDGVRVHFSIAPEDLTFMMHTLIASVPEALIGSLKRLGSIKEAH
ncbi:MAG TPA: hypothetical protein VGL08_14080 [Paraburkholderia sp.]|jgi:hypothetical protein